MGSLVECPWQPQQPTATKFPFVNMVFIFFPESYEFIQARFSIAKATCTSRFIVLDNYPLILFLVITSPSFPIADVMFTGK